MKVVLINPHGRSPGEIQQKCFAPVNLLYLAASLEAGGHEAEIIDANALDLGDQAIADRASKAQPGLVGISLLSEIMAPVFRLTARIKQTCPDVPIVLGGPHANALPERVLREFIDADLVLTGESEENIVILCRALEDEQDLGRVPGLYFRKDGDIVGNDAATVIKDLDRLPPPDRSCLAEAYQKDRYFMVLVRQRPVETILTSRGCPFGCRFCSNIPGRFRPRSPDNVMEEIVERYQAGIRHFDIADANFTFDPARALTIFDHIIKEKLAISFRYKTRTTAITPELVKKSKQAGAYLISMGLESGSQEMLDRMNKKTKVSDNIVACETVMKAGLKLNTGWVVGFPGETRDTLAETVRLLIKLKPTTANIGRLVPYPGTDVYEEARANNTLRGDWAADNGFVPWVQLPWINSLAELESVTRQVINKVYWRPHYMRQFIGEIAGNWNMTLARYAFQEARKTFKMGM